MFQLFHLPGRRAWAQPALDLKDLKQLAFPAFANKSGHLLQLPFVKKTDRGGGQGKGEGGEQNAAVDSFFFFCFFKTHLISGGMTWSAKVELKCNWELAQHFFFL